MRNQISRLVIICIVCVLALLALGGYSSSQAAGTNTPKPSRTPIPTRTLRPTRTPLPTRTPRPSSTPKASPTSAVTVVGTLALVVNDPPGTDTLYLVSTDGKNFNSLGSGSAPAWSPDGQHLAFKGNGGLVVADADGSNPKRVQGTAQTLGWFAWASDSQNITFVADDNTVTNANLATGQLQSLFKITGTAGKTYSVEALRWSPDGQYLAYFLNYNGSNTSELHVIDATGSNDQNILSASSFVAPMWSPDSTKVAYCGTTPQNLGGIFVTDLTSKTPKQVAPGCDFGADWSPDGSQFAYSDQFSNGKTGGDLYFVGAAGGKPRYVPLPIGPEVSIADISWRPPVTGNSASATSAATMSGTTASTESATMAATSSGG